MLFVAYLNWYLGIKKREYFLKILPPCMSKFKTFRTYVHMKFFFFK